MDIVKEEVCIIIYIINNIFQETMDKLSDWIKLTHIRNMTDITDIKSLGIKANDVILLFDPWHPLFLLFSAFLLVGMIGLEIISVVLLYLIITSLRKKSASFTSNTYRLHIQFSVLLISQLLCPLIFIGLSLTLCIIYMFVQISSTRLAGEIGLIGLLLYGLSNSLITIAFVTPYRKHLLNSLSKIFRLNTTNSSTQVQSAPSTIVIRFQKVKTKDMQNK
jgi:hypothetical protein